MDFFNLDNLENFTNDQEFFVLSIFGDYGLGKSTFLNDFIKILKNEKGNSKQRFPVGNPGSDERVTRGIYLWPEILSIEWVIN